MSLPAPSLDDRRFQDLVDDAKRVLHHHCPEWTDHNVSDPGVTLIEAFAFMVDQLIYRLNRVPDRLYVKFLELQGIRLFAPRAASVDVTFWLSAPQPAAVRIPMDTAVATLRTDTDEAVSFLTVRDLEIPTCSLRTVSTSVESAEVHKRLAQLRSGRGFYCFDREPSPGNALLVGLDRPVPECALLLTFDCQIEGVGVDPTDPPLVWEAWVGDRWDSCAVDRDETGGLNRAGHVVIHVPSGHTSLALGGDGAGWVRCRVVPAREGQPQYSASPRIVSLEAATIGGTTSAVNADVVNDEPLGVAEGVAGQHVALRHQPVVAGSEAPVIIEISEGEGWQGWREVQSFADSTADSRDFLVDRTAGEVGFGPAVREPDGTLRNYGAVPKKGAVVRARSYRFGGGRVGNVSAGAIRVLKSAIPYVDRVENRRAARGGVDGETLDEAKVRGPITLRTRGRAVTADDYEVLAREAAPSVARVRCVPAGDGADTGSVRVLVVPARGADASGPLQFGELVPDEAQLQAIAEYLDDRRIIGARAVVEPPVYLGMTVVAQVRPRPRADTERLEIDAVDALYRYFDPISGGPDGGGWPFGRPVNVGEVYSVLQRLPAVELVEDARLFAADPVTSKRGPATPRLEVEPNGLVFSFQHQVRVAR